MTPVTSITAEKGLKTLPLRTKPAGNIMKLYLQTSDKYAGIIMIPTLCRLSREFQVRLDATLRFSKSSAGRTKQTELPTEAVEEAETSVRLVVYGQHNVKNEVGSFLSDAGLYLQHPYAGECDFSVEYHNPHYLIRPRGSMPRLEDLSLDPIMTSEEQTIVLDESTKTRVLQIFDCAVGPATLIEAEPSSRLRSKLYP